MVDSRAQIALSNGWILGIFAYFIHIAVLQYLYNVPALCLECYLNWNMYWNRWWDTWHAIFTLIPFIVIYIVLFLRNRD